MLATTRVHRLPESLGTCVTKSLSTHAFHFPEEANRWQSQPRNLAGGAGPQNAKGLPNEEGPT